jgi:hypothetical protein
MRTLGACAGRPGVPSHVSAVSNLEQAITSMFAVMNVYTGDQAKLTLQVAEWCHYLEDFPLFAIRKACEVGGCQEGQAAKRCRLHS